MDTPVNGLYSTDRYQLIIFFQKAIPTLQHLDHTFGLIGSGQPIFPSVNSIFLCFANYLEEYQPLFIVFMKEVYFIFIVKAVPGWKSKDCM